MTPLQALGAALALGLLGDLLFRGTGLGINLTMWVVVLALEWLALIRSRGLPATAGERRSWSLLLFFATAQVWRASPALTALNFLTMLGVACLLPLAWPEAYPAWSRMTVGDAFRSIGRATAALVIGFLPPLFHPEGPRNLTLGRSGRIALEVGRGVLLATPLLLLFGGLFVAADQGFARLTSGLLDFDLSSLVPHLLFVGGFAWIGAAFLAMAERTTSAVSPAPGGVVRGPSLGAIELGVILGLLNLLFLCFVALQVEYLFGGAAMVSRVAGLTLAEYARRGFFELVTVAALVLPVTMIGQAMTRPEPAALRTFRWLATGLVGLVFLVMGSAVHRMMLYEGAFGLTELRFYTTCFMGWLAVVFLWQLGTSLRGRPERFLSGALVSWAIGVGSLDLVNPERIIVETNVARAQAGRPIDIGYLAGLSADAVPALLESLPALNDAERRAALPVLGAKSLAVPDDWRSWSLARHRARAAIQASADRLQSLEALHLNQ